MDHFDLTESERDIYACLSTDVGRTAQQIVQASGCARASVYRAMARLVELGLVAVVPTWPRAYIRPSPETLLRHEGRVLRRRLDEIENAGGDALIEDQPSIPKEAIRYLQGRWRIYEAMIDEVGQVRSTWDFMGLEGHAASWCRASGLLDRGRMPRGARRRLIYADTPTNRSVMDDIMPLAETEVRFVEVDRCLRFSIADGRQLTQIIRPSLSKKFKAPDELAFVTGMPGLIESHEALFEAMWRDAKA